MGGEAKDSDIRLIPTYIYLQSAHPLLKYYGGSVISALQQIYPNATIDPMKFKRAPSTFSFPTFFFFCIHYINSGNHWQDLNNRRLFFIDFATSMGLDPLQASQWEQVSKDDILASKVNKIVLILYSNFNKNISNNKHNIYLECLLILYI